MTDASGQRTDARVQISEVTILSQDPVPRALRLEPYTFNHLVVRIKSKQSEIPNAISQIERLVTRDS